VVYLLHGYPGGPADPFSNGLAAILNERLRLGYEPFVVASPDGNGEHHSDTEWANSWNGSDQVMSRVVDAVIPAVEGTHRRPRALRVIAGFSMGGYGAMNIGMQNRATFGSVVSIDGYFVINDLSDMYGNKPAVQQRNDPSAHPRWARGMNVILEEDADDPLSLVRGQAAWMGGLLRRAGIPAIVRISSGSHSWAYALRALSDSLTYLDQYWQQASERVLAAFGYVVGQQPECRVTGERADHAEVVPVQRRDDVRAVFPREYDVHRVRQPDCGIVTQDSVRGD
jgi:predicted esterase